MNDEFTWAVERYKFYSISIEKDGYKFSSQSVYPTSSEHVKDLYLHGKAALFLWASDVANTTIIDELRDELIYNESFTDVLYYENAADWEDAIDDINNYDGPSSLAFIYVHAHGAQYYNEAGYYSRVYYQGNSS